MITQADLDKIYSEFDRIVYNPKMSEITKLKIELAEAIIKNRNILNLSIEQHNIINQIRKLQKGGNIWNTNAS